MRAVSKLGLALILILVLIVLALILELLYVLWYRRRFRRATSIEVSHLVGADSSQLGAHASKELILYLLCYKNQTSVEPAVNVSTLSAVSVAADRDAPPTPSITKEEAEKKVKERNTDRWQATSGGPSINEEERGEATESSTMRRFEGKVREETTASETPCDSPPFYTPVASPSRDPVAVDRRMVAL